MDRINKTLNDDLPIEAELLRKSVHFIACFALVLIYPLLNKSISLALLIPGSLILFLFEMGRMQSTTFSNFVKRKFKYLLRAGELESSMGKIHIIGSTWACWSFTVLAILFPLHIAVPCFTLFLMADAMAAIVGNTIGKMNWPNSKKTLEGSLAFFFTGLMILFLFPDVGFKTGAIAVLIATFAEIPNGPLDDNFRVPLTAATTLFVVENLFV